jgi:hypothetical protein
MLWQQHGVVGLITEQHAITELLLVAAMSSQGMFALATAFQPVLVGRRLITSLFMSCSIFERDSLCCDTAAAAAGRWPEDLPPGSVVVLSGKDDLMDSGAVRAMLERAGHVQVGAWEGRRGGHDVWQTSDVLRRCSRFI